MPNITFDTKITIVLAIISLAVGGLLARYPEAGMVIVFVSILAFLAVIIYWYPARKAAAAALLAVLFIFGVGYLGYTLSLCISELPHPSMIIAKTEAGLPGAYPNHFAVNVYWRNRGMADMIGPRQVYRVVYSDTPGNIPHMLDNAAANLLFNLKTSRTTNSTSIVAVGQGGQYSAFGDKDIYLKNKQRGTGELYLLMFVEYKDKYLTPDKWWVSEFCWQIWLNDSLPRCGSHKYQYKASS
jgi:hypothetical protein